MNSTSLKVFLIALLSVMTVSKFLMVNQLPLEMHCYSDFDDFLFVNHANNILEGKWFGEYNDKTLVKGPIYPLFIAASHKTGLQIKSAEWLLYISSAAFLSVLFFLCTERAYLSLSLYTLLLLNPYLEVVTRLMRSGLYTSEILLSISGLLLLTLSTDRGAIPRLASGLFCGSVFFCFWYTREEGIWILPLVVLFIGMLFREIYTSRFNLTVKILLPYGLTIITFFVFQHILVSTTERQYGTREVVDLFSSPVLEAHKALFRVKHNGAPYVALPRSVRDHLQQVSPSYAMISPLIEKYIKRGHYQCHFHPETCGEIANDLVTWYLRYALAENGMYSDPKVVDSFYLSLSNEINKACENGMIDCLDPIYPHFSHFRTLSDIERGFYAFGRGLKFLWKGVYRQKNVNGILKESKCHYDDRLQLFQYITNTSDDRLVMDLQEWKASRTGSGYARENGARYLLSFKRVYDSLILKVSILMIVLLVILVSRSVCINGVVPFSIVLASMVLSAILFRIAILAIFDASTFPAFSKRYLSCLFPMISVLLVLLLDGYLSQRKG